MNVTPKQMKVLRAVRDLYAMRAEYPDHHMIAVECGQKYSTSGWAHAPLRKLSAMRLVSSVGKPSPWSGRRWKINESGLKLIGDQ
jgi:hypothetical protein